MKLYSQERDAILAGLRLLHKADYNNNLPAEVADILTNEGEHEGLTLDEVDSLCERLNDDAVLVKPRTCAFCGKDNPPEAAACTNCGKRKMQQHCAQCGSTDVLCDAYAKWNVDAQEWEITSTFDKGAFCSKCDGETRIEGREVQS